jgi:hypothetical protein
VTDPKIRDLADELIPSAYDELELGLVDFEFFAELAWGASLDLETGATEDEVMAAAGLLWDDRIAEQARWVGTSDADRLQDAFDELNQQTIFARMNFECCGTCAGYLLWDKIKPAHLELTGYVYFNTQSAERILSERQVGLAYGSFVPIGAPGEDEADDAVATLILATLRARGLQARRQGRWGIEVDLPDWRRRLPAREQASS